MATKADKIREAQSGIKVPVYGNKDTERRFLFDKHKEDFYLIAKIPVRTVKVGTETQVQSFDSLARVFTLTPDDYEEFFVHSKAYKNDATTMYMVIHDPTEGPAVDAGEGAVAATAKTKVTRKSKDKDSEE